MSAYRCRSFLVVTLLSINVFSGEMCFTRFKNGRLIQEGDCESMDDHSVFNELDAKVKGMSYRPRSCKEVRSEFAKIQNKTGGVFDVDYPAIGEIDVFCDTTTDGGGWTVIQRRMDGSVDFYRSRGDYVNGFGEVSGEFWLGLENVYNILDVNKFQLRIDFEDWDGVKKFAKYSYFDISSRYDDYKLTIGGYSGTAGDSMAEHNGQKFTTKDHDVDAHASNCAQLFKGGWWYSNCHHANLNGLYHKGNHTSYADGVNWYAWKGYYYSLKFVEMKIRSGVKYYYIQRIGKRIKQAD